jgi:DNA-binding transcriptional regulator GbsR (MarR family)
MLMRDGRWRTLDEIARSTGDPHASISAQLRHLRKARFGEHTVDKRARGDRRQGLFEYRVQVNLPEPMQASLFAYFEGGE